MNRCSKRAFEGFVLGFLGTLAIFTVFFFVGWVLGGFLFKTPEVTDTHQPVPAYVAPQFKD
jgi:hypothetical protein